MVKFRDLLIYFILAFLPFILIILILRFTNGLNPAFRFADFWQLLEYFPYTLNLDDMISDIQRIVASTTNLIEILQGVRDFSILGIIRGLWSVLYQILITTFDLLLLPFRTIYYLWQWISEVVKFFLSV